MRTMNFDAIAASAPPDRQASTVRDGSGDLFTVAIPDDREHWEAPPLPEADMPEVIEDLTGRMIGRMTVVRYHGRRAGQGAWLVRCCCGDYEVRRGSSIRRNAQPDHACIECNHLQRIVFAAGPGSTMATRKAEESRLDAIAQSSHTPKA